MDFDHVLGLVGHFGPYQLVMYILLCLPASLPSAWSAFNQVFVAADPPHWCKVPSAINESERHRFIPLAVDSVEGARKFNACYQFVEPLDYGVEIADLDRPVEKCDKGWDFNNSTYSRTIVTDFELYCDRAWLVETSSTMYYVGSFIGNFLFGWVADKWGRRFSFFSILAIQVVFGTASAMAWSIDSFIVLRFIVGFTFPALYQIPFIVCMELMGPSKRIFSGMVVCVFFGTSLSVLGLIAWLIRDWVLITIVSNTPFVLLFSYWFFLPESPRWLLIVNKVDAAAKVLANIGKYNKKATDERVLRQYCQRLCNRAEAESIASMGSGTQATLLDLFRTPNLRRKTIIITFVWFVNGLVYNGLTLYSSNLPVNDYLSFSINGFHHDEVVSGLVELPAYFILWPLLHKIGRRWPLSFCMLFGGVACLATMAVSGDSKWVIAGMAFAAKFGNAGSFAVIYIFAGELYPTVLRGIGMGMSSMVAGTGLVMAPTLVGLSSVHKLLPMIIMGILMLSAGVAAVFLPDTLGAPLPQTVLDAELYGADFKFCECGKIRSNDEDTIELQIPMMQKPF